MMLSDKKRVLIYTLIGLCASLSVADIQSADGDSCENTSPWRAGYCMSLLNKTRSAKVLPEGKWSLSLKYKNMDNDQKETTQGVYTGMPTGQSNHKQKYTLCTKYAWAKDHHIAIGVPWLNNNLRYKSIDNQSAGFGNIYIFEKWNFFKETDFWPAMSVDFWYFFPTGDPARKLGTDDSAYKLTGSASKTWEHFSVHFNPGYKWNSKSGPNDEIEINSAILFTPSKTLWPVLEYNYLHRENSGSSHDLVPGLIWKFRKVGSFKFGLPVNLNSTFTYRDRVGLLLTLCQIF